MSVVNNMKIKDYLDVWLGYTADNIQAIDRVLKKEREFLDVKVFTPTSVDEYEIMTKGFSNKDIDLTHLFKYALKNDDVELERKNEILRNFLSSEVFHDMASKSRPSYQIKHHIVNENSIYYNSLVSEELAFKAKDKLEELGYKVMVYTNTIYHDEYDDYDDADKDPICFNFVCATDEKNLKEAYDYINKINREVIYTTSQFTQDNSEEFQKIVELASFINKQDTSLLYKAFFYNELDNENLSEKECEEILDRSYDFFLQSDCNFINENLTDELYAIREEVLDERAEEAEEIEEEQVKTKNKRRM